MIGQYLPNNNETATVAFHQKILPTKQPLGTPSLVELKKSQI
jgi:hypothetical protein